MENEIKEKIEGILNPQKQGKEKPINTAVPYRIRPATKKLIKSWVKKTNSKNYNETFVKVDKILSLIMNGEKKQINETV